MSRSTVAAVLAETHPDRTLESVEPVAEGNRRQTAVARFEAGPAVVVRLRAEGATLRTEAALARAISERTTVPVPEPLAAGTHEGTAYLVTEHRPGEDIHARFASFGPGARRRIAREFGRYLGELHEAFVFEGCGELNAVERTESPGEPEGPDGGRCRARLASAGRNCGRWLVEYGLAAVQRLPEEFDPLRDELEECVRTAPEPDGNPARLFPWDLRPGNALVAEEEVTAVVDWERPLAAPPEVALAKTEYLVADWYVEEPAPLRTALRRGYERVRPLPDVRAAHRVAAVADSAVDSRGQVTNPRHPELGRERSVAFHREALERAAADPSGGADC